MSGPPSPTGDLVSDWRTPCRPFLARTALVSALFLAVMALAAGLSLGGRWSGAEFGVPLREVLAYSVVIAGLLTWLSVLHAQTAVTITPSVLRTPGEGREGTHLVRSSAFAGIRRERTLPVSDIAHLTLETSPGGLRPWIVAAVMPARPGAGKPARRPARSGPRGPALSRVEGSFRVRGAGKPASLTRQRRELLLRYRAEVSARAALRHLGSRLGRPIVVRCEGGEMRTEPEEIGLPLWQRVCREGLPRPAGQPPAAPPAAPRGTSLRISETDEGWELGYTTLAREVSGTLLGCAAVPVAITALSTALLVYRADLAAARLMWAVAAFLLASTTYLALALRDEFLARLAGTRVVIPREALRSLGEGGRVEIAEGEIRFHSPEGKIETVRLADIETIEPGRIGETATIAVVTPERVLHMAGLGQPEEREWVMEAIRSAIARFP